MTIALSRRTARRATSVRSRVSDGVAVAVVGSGYWGSKHVRVLSSLPDVSLVIVVDPDPGVRASIAAAFPNIEVAATLAAVLGNVDAVVVATPPVTHAAVSLQALRAGKGVLVEKPLATTLHDARIVVAEAERHHAALMVGHTFEFNPAVIELRKRMDDGELGEVRYIHSARLNLGLYRPDVNVVWDLAPHDISIMNFLLRSTPGSVRAWGSANIAKQADLAYFQLDYGQGVTGYGHVSWLDPRKVRQVTVVGSRKMAVYDDLAEERLRIFDRGVDPTSLAVSASLHEMPVSYRYGDVVSPHIAQREPLVIEDQAFIQAVRDGSRPSSDGTSGLAVIAALEAIDRSLATGLMADVDMEGSAPSTEMLAWA